MFSESSPKASRCKYIDKDGRKYKSAWGKVRDIIHTRKDSLKQKKAGKKVTSSETIDVDPSSGISVEISAVTDDEEGKNSSDLDLCGNHRKFSEPDWSKYPHGSTLAIPTKATESASAPTSKKTSMVLNLVPNQHGGLADRGYELWRSSSFSGAKGEPDLTGYTSSSSCQRVASKWKKVKKVFIKRKTRGDRAAEAARRTHRSLSIPTEPYDSRSIDGSSGHDNDFTLIGNFIFSIKIFLLLSPNKMWVDPPIYRRNYFAAIYR